MNKNLTVALLSLGIVATSGVVLADEKLEISQEGTQTVVLSGSLGEKNANVGVTAQVFSQGYDYDDLKNIPEGKTIYDIIKFHDETMTDDEGNYEFKFDISTESQWITPFISTATVKVGGNEYDYMFVNDDEWRQVAGKINKAGSVADVLECINDNSFVLGFSASDLKDIDKNNLANVILNTVDDEKLNLDDRDASWCLLKQALMVERLNEGKIEDIYKEAESLREFSDSDIKDWYDKDFRTDKFNKDFTNRLLNRDFESFNEYKDALLESFILATVRYPNGADNIKNIIEEFEDEIGVSVKSAKNHVWSTLSGEDFNDYEELAEGFEDAVKNPPKTSGGGGGGGSSSSKGTVSNYTGSIFDLGTKENTAEPIAKDIFVDLDSVSWAKEAIVALAEKQIVNGVGDSKFAPNDNVTREQFAKIVMGAFKVEDKGEKAEFSDVLPGAWYEEAVNSAYGAGIVKGMSDYEFGVGKNITRQDMCVMIYRAAVASGMEIKTEDYVEFSDDTEIADYAKEAVYSLREFGAVSGMTNDEFAPAEFATRAQAAKIIYYLISGK